MDERFLRADLGRMGHAAAVEAQHEAHARVLAAREAGGPLLGEILVVEHDPVITVTRRPGAADHVLATADHLRALGVEVHPTDRGGDVTYHGPGQVVVYPVVDLKRLGLRVVEYVRTLERAIIEAIGGFGVAGERDPEATGVWVTNSGSGFGSGQGEPAAKVAAIGVRVRKWATLHGLALNVRPDLSHFQLIVPCGLADRPVTSLERLLGERCPATGDAATAVVERLAVLLSEAAAGGSAEVAALEQEHGDAEEAAGLDE